VRPVALRGDDANNAAVLSPSSRRALVGAALLAAVAAGAGPARAHVAPAEDVDNRYVKLTPMGDRVRVAYTIWIGQKPGTALRRRLDRDRDGRIGDAEARIYGEDLAGRVRPALAITIDGRPAPIAWSTIDVGLGTPDVAAGAFSIDLIGWICTGGGDHRLVLRDTFALERPGETELRLEEVHGVTLGERRLGGERLDALDARWSGADGPLVTAGLELAWSAGGEAVRPADGRCHAGATTGRKTWPWIAGGALAAVAVALVARRRRPRARGAQPPIRT